MAGDRSGPAADAALVREIAAGSQDALAILYDRHADAVYHAACRLTSDRQVAEEVVQETFLALWNRAELFNPAVGSLAAWLHTIARNRTVDRLRAAGRRPNLVALSSASGADENDTAALDRLVTSGRVLGGADLGPGPERALESAEVRLAVQGALAAMPEAERTVIVLAYHEELSQTEIAARLGWPLGTVKTRTRRALLHLRDALAGELREPLDREETPVGVREGWAE
ncbi:MAG: sigma-70 family RNA polymerase sigma factor [Chloroflexota bacterium]|nr:sigma-70 family RNA polymerase sigma factor [Chloroflexota bacterium]